MATPGKATKKTPRKNASGAKPGAQDPAARLSKGLSESAQQIWLAGVGAFGRAQAEGSKLFDGLVKEGLSLEQSARKFAGGQAEVMRDAVESGVDTARERAADTWGRLEKVFEGGVHRALTKLGVPDRDDIADLGRRVDTLTAELRKQGRKVPASAAPRKPVARKTASKHAVGPAAKVTKNAGKKPAIKKAAGKSSARPKPTATR